MASGSIPDVDSSHHGTSSAVAISSEQQTIKQLLVVWHFNLGCVYTVPDHFLIRYKVLRISRAFTLDKVSLYNFVPAIRYSFVPARKEEHFLYLHCSETVPVQCKCEGKGKFLYRIKSDPVQCKCSLGLP